MRTFGRAVVVSVAMASALMAVDGCARAEPVAAADAVPAVGPDAYAPGYGYRDNFGGYGRGWSGDTWNRGRASDGGWWPPRYAPRRQWRPRATRPYWAGPRRRSGNDAYAWGNRDWRTPERRYGNGYGPGYGDGYGNNYGPGFSQSPPYLGRQYRRPYGYADWQWAQRY